MKTKPIIFSAPMVRALLDGRKSQTRRNLTVRTRDGEVLPPSTHYAPGDLLWVRETFWQSSRYPFTMPCGEPSPQSMNWGSRWQYAADGEPENTPNRHYPEGLKGGLIAAPDPDAIWVRRPSIHMPRWASRLTLEVTEVRVQRLWDMEGQHPSESDAIAEGVNSIHHGDGAYYYSAFRNEPHPKNWCDPTDAFRELWNGLHGPDAWERNPWVAAITFKTHHKNVDALLAERGAA